MALHDYPGRVLLAAIFSSLIVLGMCGTVAAFLASSQVQTADVLRENIDSWWAAANLEEVLASLTVLHDLGVKDVAPVHERAEARLADIKRLADKEKERELA